ncbi:hypothetical protein [Pseudomonas sp. BP8]|uniref:hypothetical protein n=1 Tax=Pseudomonas sp. BP8 TaxID=2817864 RepID=UPI001AE225B3|nr:hypothetical protein [Pseudomonas sp. BP8]MBP2262688.1 hypothetical protein [Pseudomonas sp. BP8]HDS1734289.1 hypothetical protein [Pseudomonas putida]
MNTRYRALSANLELDYVRDTFLGPVAHRAQCQVQVATMTLRGCPALRLHVSPPIPAKLDCAHSVAFTWEGRSYRGVVGDHSKCGDGGLNLILELR